MMKNVFWLTAIAIFLAGCASTQPLPDERRTTIKKVGVISLIGDEFRFTKVGLTLFNSDEFTKNIAAWQLDKLAVQSATGVLREAEPPIRLVALPTDHNLVNKLYRQEGEFGSYVNLKRIRDDLKTLLDKHPVDALIVIHNEQVLDPIQGTAILLYGPGLYYRNLPYAEPFVKPHFFFRVVVLDGKTLKPISQKLVKSVSKDFGKMQISWEDEIKTNLSDKLWNKIQLDIKHMIKTNVTSALQDAGL